MFGYISAFVQSAVVILGAIAAGMSIVFVITVVYDKIARELHLPEGCGILVFLVFLAIGALTIAVYADGGFLWSIPK